MVRAEVIAEGVRFAEGPVWCPDGTLVVSHLSPGALRRIWPESGRSELIARTRGSANAAQLASDGGFVVTQNGGIDFMVYADVLGLSEDDRPPYEPVTAGIQRVSPSAEVSYLCDGDFLGPNDLIVDLDGTIYFTDPGRSPVAGASEGRLMSLTPGGEVKLIADGFHYDNGIALSPSGRILVVEENGLMWVSKDGDKEWLVRSMGEHAGDGLGFDQDGRIYVASPLGHCIHVFEPDGKLADTHPLPDGSIVTNLCFGGDDLRTLFIVEIMPGRVHAMQGMPCPGLPPTPWPVSVSG
jgi:gluconolactonase